MNLSNKSIHLTAFFITLVVFLSSCHIIKVVSLMKSGKTVKGPVYAEVPFEMVSGIIILKVKVEGEDYDFYLDTGAPNVLSLEIAEKMGLKPLCEIPSSDSQGNKGKISFSKVNSIEIGDIVFKKQGVALIDFSENQEISCMEMKGLIGANLMRQAYWQINMNTKTIIISSDIERLHIPADAFVIPFTQQITKTPEVSVTIGNTPVKNVIFDYGSNSGIEIGIKDISSMLDNGNSYRRAFGEGSYGLYGGAYDTTFSVYVDHLQLGNLVTHDIVDIRKTGKSTIGTDFLGKYIVSFDWKEKQIYLEQLEKDTVSTLETFGFSVILKDSMLEVAYIYEDSPAYISGMRLGDRILSVNDMDYTSITMKEYCDIVKDGLIPEDARVVDVTFRNKEGKKNVQLTKENIF